MDARPQETVDAVPFHEYRFEDGTVWTEFYRWDSGYLLRFPGIADFEVSADGTDVTAHPAEDCDESTLEHLFINQLLPLALSRQVRPAFHASVVTVPGGAVAFLGKTGMGKSTLAASFALGGSEFLADDSLLIDESRGGCLALPSHASLRLWEDSVEAIVGDQSTIQETSGSSRCMDWIEHSFLLDVEDKALLSRHFDWTHRISEAVATYTLDYPRQYGILPKVRSAVLQMVSDDGN
jgi:hypothetical protein